MLRHGSGGRAVTEWTASIKSRPRRKILADQARTWESRIDEAMESVDEAQLLRKLGRASADLLRLAHPFRSPDPPKLDDDWPYPLALNWRLQLRYLWAAAADAFDIVAAVLPKRASSAVLGQVRLILETYCQVTWLAEAEDERQRRACSLVLSEVQDLRGVVSAWSTHEAARTKMLDMLKDMEAEANRRAQAVGGAVRVPSLQTLLHRYGYGSVAYGVLSDIGTHAGIASSLAFFHVPDARAIDMNLSGGILQRAYFLGMAYELFGRTVEVIAAARSWDDLSAAVRGQIDAHGQLLQEITRLLEERGAP